MLTYQYQSPSTIQKRNGQEEILLSKYREIQKKEATCFFWGKLNNPYITARCLLTLSNVVKSSFNLSPFQLAMLKDPIVTAGNEHIRFEGFSHCAGVYARVDVLPDGHDGEFLENGTTNVDFNEPMLAALSNVCKQEKVVLSVGKKEVSLSKGGQKVVERKVPLPTKWIKGLTTVQLYLAESEAVFTFNRIQTIQLLRSITKGKIKNDYYLVLRGNRPQFSPVKTSNGICIGGLHRLRLLLPLVPLADKLQVFSHPKQQSTTWQLYFGNVRFSLSISRDFWRGFSGEGAALAALVEDIPTSWIEHFDNYSYANQTFNPTMMAIQEDIDFRKVENLTWEKILPSKSINLFFLYDYLKLEYIWSIANDNAVNRFISFVPNNSGTIISLITQKCLVRGGIWGETGKKVARYAAQNLLDNAIENDEMTHLFTSVLLTCNDKPNRSVAAEIWLKGVREQNMDSQLIGNIIGQMTQIEFFPLKRLLDTIQEQLFQVSHRHNRALAIMLQEIILQLPSVPIRNTKRLLEIYGEVVSLGKKETLPNAVLEKVMKWETIGSLKKIVGRLYNIK